MGDLPVTKFVPKPAAFLTLPRFPIVAVAIVTPATASLLITSAATRATADSSDCFTEMCGGVVASMMMWATQCRQDSRLIAVGLDLNTTFAGQCQECTGLLVTAQAPPSLATLAGLD